MYDDPILDVEGAFVIPSTRLLSSTLTRMEVA
jgi:hypothetical protein